MLFHFDRKRVELMLTHAEDAKVWKRTFGQRGRPHAALWLVGNDGICLMSNGDPCQPSDGYSDSECYVAYARECDPELMPFDEWWAVKRANFGNDDGVESFACTEIRKALLTHKDWEELAFDITPTSIGLCSFRTVPQKLMDQIQQASKTIDDFRKRRKSSV